MDPTRPPSPTTPMDFPPDPYLSTFIPHTKPSNSDNHFGDIFDSILYDTVSRIQCHARTVGLDGADPTIFRFHGTADMMADTGANCGVTGNRDVLTNIRTIPPLDITLALTTNDSTQPALPAALRWVTSPSPTPTETSFTSLCSSTVEPLIPLSLPKGFSTPTHAFTRSNSKASAMNPVAPYASTPAAVDSLSTSPYRNGMASTTHPSTRH